MADASLRTDPEQTAGWVWHSPWDARSKPIDIHELELRLRDAERHADRYREQVVALTRRIEVGTEKIEAARQAGASENTILDAERRLKELRDQRDQLYDQHLLPHDLLTTLRTAARSAAGRPSGSWIAIHVPGVVRCAVSLGVDEPPF
ncbi:MAG TPA: hypothetical protein VOB72_04790 [Candidatus Dormibacteraeota bacterium]|nr:hypothetical protein [Candidatus Dormibacteraeota bacterium]